MASFAAFLCETLLASVVLACVACAGTKVILSQVLSRDLELHKLRLRELAEKEVERLRPERSTVPVAPSKVDLPDERREQLAERLFQLFDSATLSIIRFSLEFRTEKLEAADQAGRAAIEDTSRLSNFARLNRHHFPGILGESLEAPAAALRELAWRSYKTFKDPSLSEKQTAAQIEAFNLQAVDIGKQIELVKVEIVKFVSTP